MQIGQPPFGVDGEIQVRNTLGSSTKCFTIRDLHLGVRGVDGYRSLKIRSRRTPNLWPLCLGCRVAMWPDRAVQSRSPVWYPRLTSQATYNHTPGSANPECTDSCKHQHSDHFTVAIYTGVYLRNVSGVEGHDPSLAHPIVHRRCVGKLSARTPGQRPFTYVASDPSSGWDEPRAFRSCRTK